MPARKKDVPPQENFYAKALDETEKLDLKIASGVDGIDQEIALLRVQIKSILQENPKDLNSIIRATNALEKLVRTPYNINREQRKGLKEAIGNVIKDIAVPLGVGVTIGRLK